MAESRKVAILATSRRSGHSGPEGRLGPPDSSRKAGKAGKAGKARFWPFLRGTRALGQGVPGPVIGRGWAHSVPSPPSDMRGLLGSWSPTHVVGPWTGPQCSGPFQAQNRGDGCKQPSPSYVCISGGRAALGPHTHPGRLQGPRSPTGA